MQAPTTESNCNARQDPDPLQTPIARWDADRYPNVLRNHNRDPNTGWNSNRNPDSGWNPRVGGNRYLGGDTNLGWSSDC